MLRVPASFTLAVCVCPLILVAVAQNLLIEDCPTSCELVFEKLGEGINGSPSGNRSIQHVEVQERGEPKSGTTFMYQWAMAALSRTCVYLRKAYGEESCVMSRSSDGMNSTLLFDPARAAGREARCLCDTVARVTISLIQEGKHTLPVAPECGLKHLNSIAWHTHKVCVPPDGEVPTNQAELWDCVTKAGCHVVDDRSQMVIFRDPRPVAVSAYYYLLHNYPRAIKFDSVREYVAALLPVMTKWISVRYLLFVELPVPQPPSIYWYNETLSDPIEWHRKFYSSIGIRLPEDVIAEQARRAALGDSMFGMVPKGYDLHFDPKDNSTTQSFRDLGAATVEEMNNELRLWLPPVVLDKLDL